MPPLLISCYLETLNSSSNLLSITPTRNSPPCELIASALLPFIFLPWAFLAHVPTTSIPRDTSFTISSAARDVQAQYPFARVVTPEPSEGVVDRWNIVYATVGRRELHLDLFHPKDPTSGPFPGIVLIHGGGWRSGDRSMQIPLARFLAEHGYVTAAVGYRLSPEAMYPAAVSDIKAAVRWMRAHASEFNIDSARIAVSGCSPGGYLAALVGTTNGDLRFDGNPGNPAHSSAVQAVIDMDGILDFTDPAESGKDTIPGKLSAGASWFGATYRVKPELWIETSPVVHVNANTPPIVFINSSNALSRRQRCDDRKTEETRYLPGSPHNAGYSSSILVVPPLV